MPTNTPPQVNGTDPKREKGAIENDQLSALVDEVWHVRLRESPEFATVVGHHGYNDVLEDFSPEASERRQMVFTEFMSRIDAFDVTSLNRADRVTLQLLRDGLHRNTSGYKWRNHGMVNPINYMEGVHIDFLNTLDVTPFNNEVDYTNYISRLGALKKKIEQTIDQLRIAITKKTTSHRVSVMAIPKQISNYYTSKEPSSMTVYEPFKGTLDALPLPDSTKRRLRESALDVLNEVVKPAFQELSDFITEVYLPATRADVGVSSIPDGRAFYEASLQWHGTCDLSVEEVHQMGVDEVARIKAEMERIKEKFGFSGTLQEFVSYLKSDSTHFYKTEEEVVDGYKNMVTDRCNPNLPTVFKEYPELPVEVRRCMNNINTSSAGRYAEGALDGSRPGVFLVNANDPQQRAKFNMAALTLHEVTPGHHLQSSIAIAVDLPLFRRIQDFRRYFAVPYNFPFYTAFIEGWALYAEYLGEEMGVYKDDYERFGMLTSELLRACRLVVDTGLHVMGWGKQEAVDYMAAYVLMPDSQIESEVNRYITIPGQACSYKIGELKIKELRKKAEHKLGSAFDVKEFHDVILRQGAVPLNVMEETVNSWLATQQNNND